MVGLKVLWGFLSIISVSFLLKSGNVMFFPALGSLFIYKDYMNFDVLFQTFKVQWLLSGGQVGTLTVEWETDGYIDC